MKTKKLNLEDATVATAVNGSVYAIDPATKKCKKIFHEFDKVADGAIEVNQIPLSTFHKYLKDKFSGEDCTIKKGKLHFRNYRMHFDHENGFVMEDTQKKYALVDTGFDGIPTPKDLYNFFTKPAVVHTAEEIAEATELGKVLAEARTMKVTEEIESSVEVNYEKLRKKVLLKIKQVREGVDTKFDPTTFGDMIPYKKWKRKVNATLKDWKSRKIRYKKFLDVVEELTIEETFVEVEKVKRTEFVGTTLWEFKEVSELKEDKLLVDGKWVEAVPFLQNYLLYYEPKAMQQLMRFAKEEITAMELLKNPFHKDHKIEFNSKLLKNTAENAKLMDCLMAACGICSPQDLVYGGFEIGDEIMLWTAGEWKKNVVTANAEGIELRKGQGLFKLDKYIRIKKEEK